MANADFTYLKESNIMIDSTAHNITLKFRSFEAQILYFNGMYQLPVAAFPSVSYVADYERARTAKEDVILVGNYAVLKRIRDFKRVILDEISEIDEIIDTLRSQSYPTEIDFLTDTADWLGDIIIYCASEMVRYGIPIQQTLDIIMASNFSKLGADGQPIISDGKVQKGPNYWKPEPALAAMLGKLQEDYRIDQANVGKQGE